MPKIPFMMTSIDNLSMSEAVDAVEQLILQRTPSYVVTPNLDHIVRLSRSEQFMSLYEGASLRFCDGQPILWISRMYGTPIKEKVSGSDLFPHLCERAALKGYRIYLLGGDTQEVADLARKKLSEKYDGLDICGAYSPPFGFEKDELETDKIIEGIIDADPDLLIVGLGSPKQELFIAKHLQRMKVPVSLGLGATIAFEAGTLPRAPKWMQKHGLEWLFRVITNPRRMIKRYFIDDLAIIPLIFKYWPKKK